jgi:hypothetical protein
VARPRGDGQASLSFVIAGLVPAISIIGHSFAFLSEMAGTRQHKAGHDELKGLRKNDRNNAP